MEEVSFCAIAVFVPDQYGQEIAVVSEHLNNIFGSWYVLNSDIFPPHITSWIAYVPNKNLEKLADVAGDVLAKVTPFPLYSERLVFESSGYISLNIKLSNELRTIHTKLLEQLNPLREDYLPPRYRVALAKYSKEQQDSLLKYGARSAGNLFEPHITLGVVPSEMVEKAKHSISTDIELRSFDVTKLVLFRQKESGRSIEILRYYPF